MISPLKRRTLAARGEIHPDFVWKHRAGIRAGFAIVCIGCSYKDMYAAAKAVETMRGGLIVTRQGKVLARLPLPIAGLMSDRPLHEVARRSEAVRRTARGLGCKLDEPLMVLSLLDCLSLRYRGSRTEGLWT